MAYYEPGNDLTNYLVCSDFFGQGKADYDGLKLVLIVGYLEI